MDKFDQQIIDILKINGRCSVSELARDINLSRSAVTARMKKLEDDGVILGYEVKLAEAKSEQSSLGAYLALKFDTSSSTHCCESYAKKIEAIPEVQWCHAISGETDMMLYVEACSMARINEIRDHLHTYPELRHLMTHAVLNEFFNKQMKDKK
ncbi:Lrp/AsnC family transcriptional regulator [Vibrio clamense]|uniref:Lrp/AsnC family transcriptional regulator n=1 Tax=Vibrio clamense TaxID=2910254 RepID=UPI003D1FC112